MENTKNSIFKNNAIGILISIGLYLVSMFVGSIFNVLISFTAGYKEYSDFLNSDNIAGFLSIILVGLANHIFTGWLTVNIMAKYGRRQNCITRWFFRSAAIAVVVLAVVVFPILFSKNSGLMTYLSHSLSILLFGRRKVRIYNEEQALTATSNKENVINNYTSVSPVTQIEAQPTASEQKTFIYCHKCGIRLNAGTRFCHKCGTKIER
jgi:hypothetical protein